MRVFARTHVITGRRLLAVVFLAAVLAVLHLIWSLVERPR